MSSLRQVRSGTADRHRRLLAAIQLGTSRVEDLARTLDVSVATIRRDLEHMESQGLLDRTYGGARITSPFKEKALVERMEEAVIAKAAIGRTAATLLPPPGGTIFLDAGSSCSQLADHLRGRQGLTVLTRGLEIAVQLGSEPGLDVVLVGGKVTPKSHGLVGCLVNETLQRFRPDVAFLGCDAVDPVDGVGEPSLEEVETKRIAAQRSRQVVVLAHAAKLQRADVPVWSPLPRGWTLVTDAEGAQLDRFRRAKVRVLCAEALPSAS